jgi:electron transfer flavoprotein beta subunit
VSAPELHALEAVLAVRDGLEARVTALALGPVSCCDTLREALYRGADDAVLVSDPRMTGSDPLAAGYILSCALRKIGPDLVACPARTPDGDTASVGVQAAGRLGITPVTSVDRPIAVEGAAVTARRDTGAGWELVNAVLPALLTVTSAANTPRPPAMKRMMKYKKARSKGEIESAAAGGAAGVERPLRAGADRARAELEAKGLLIGTWTLDDIGADPSRCGTAGSPTRIERIQSLVLAGGSSEVFENTGAGVARLVAALLKDHTI